MTHNPSDRSSKIKSLFTNDLFISELKKIQKNNVDNNYDIEVIKFRKLWRLNWDYHETITNYLETGKVDYSLGDNDIRAIDYKAQELTPSDAPKDEFRVMSALRDSVDKGVHLKLPKELTKTVLKNFIEEHYDIIEAALGNNYPGRITYQSPEQQSKRKTNIFRMHEEDVAMKDICDRNNCDPRFVRAVVKEYKDKIS